MKQEITLGVTDRTVLVFIPDPASTDGSGKTGLVAADLTVSYARVEADNDVTITDATSSLNNLSALTDAHNDWGVKEVSNTLAPGLYRLDLADAVFASGAWSAVVYVMITSSAAAASPMEFILVAYNPLDAVRMGLTALPNANADAAGGLPISDAGGLDLDARLDAAVSSRMATYTQPTGFLAATFPTGTVANTTNITAGTITTVTNLTNAPTAGDFTNTMKTSIGTAVAASAVASVTGNVGGNVTGSVGSVVGLTASNLDATISSRASAADLATVAGYLDTEIAAILADTNELQTDWANGGRLDLILDARSSQTSVDDLPTNAELATALAAADDATLAAIAASEVKIDAIKVVTDKVDTALVLDGAVYQYTANALELAPSGGGSAPTAVQIREEIDSNSTQLTAIKAKTDSLTFTKAGEVDSNTQSINGATVNGDGTSGDLWRGA